MGLLRDGQDWLAETLEASDGVTVRYSRGPLSVTVPAVVGRTAFRQVAAVDTAPAAAVVWGDRDYLIRADKLVLGGSAVTPRKGDRVTETIGGASVVFEVTDPGTGEPCWRYSDPYRTRYRVHVKKVA